MGVKIVSTAVKVILSSNGDVYRIVPVLDGTPHPKGGIYRYQSLATVPISKRGEEEQTRQLAERIASFINSLALAGTEMDGTT